MTIPLARVIGTQRCDTPLKVTYSGNVFRANESLTGKYNEIVQSGIEIIGIDNVRAEIECVISVIQSLQKLKVQSFTIELSKYSYINVLSKSSPFMRKKKVLRTYIESKNYAALSNFIRDKKLDRCDETVKLLEKLPRLFRI